MGDGFRSEAGINLDRVIKPKIPKNTDIMEKPIDQNTASVDTTIEELRSLLAEAESVLAAGGETASEAVSNLRERLRKAVAEGQAVARRATDAAKEQAAKVDTFVHERPYVAIGVAVGLGVIAGAVVTRCICLSRSAS